MGEGVVLGLGLGVGFEVELEAGGVFGVSALPLLSPEKKMRLTANATTATKRITRKRMATPMAIFHLSSSAFHFFFFFFFCDLRCFGGVCRRFADLLDDGVSGLLVRAVRVVEGLVLDVKVHLFRPLLLCAVLCCVLCLGGTEKEKKKQKIETKTKRKQNRKHDLQSQNITKQHKTSQNSSFNFHVLFSTSSYCLVVFLPCLKGLREGNRQPEDEFVPQDRVGL